MKTKSDQARADLQRELDLKLIEAMLQTVRRLARWKHEALFVDSEWDPQRIGRLIGLTLGSSIRRNVQPAIERLQSDLAQSRAACSYADQKWNETTQLLHQYRDAEAGWSLYNHSLRQALCDSNTALKCSYLFGGGKGNKVVGEIIDANAKFLP